jgi:hypothetical protein
MTTENKISKTLSRSVCGGWDRGFLESILDQMAKGRELSIKQKQTLGKVLARNSDEAQLQHDQWETDYLEKYQTDAKILAEYHSRQPYYRPMATDILSGEVPQMQKFLKMYNNKYSKKVLASFHTEARYSISDHVAPRADFSPYKHVELETANLSYELRGGAIEKFKKHGGFILRICGEVYSHAKGSKRYKILPVGATIPLIIEERRLKLAPKQ